MKYGPYTIQYNGQVALPWELRRELGLRDGDTVVFERTDQGWLILSNELDVAKLLDELGAILTARGVTLDDLIVSGRALRAEIVRDRYLVEGTDGAPGLS